MAAKPIIPALAPLYARLEPGAYVALRVMAGAIIASFGYRKLFAGGMANEIALFHRLGLEPAAILGPFICGLEFFGGLAIVLGLLTRPIALMFVVEMLVILGVEAIPRGAGYQLATVWLGAFLFILA